MGCGGSSKGSAEAGQAPLTWQDEAMADRYRTPDGWTVLGHSFSILSS